jgi:hypothetical protein
MEGMKPVPKSAEFTRFTQAMRDILKVSKTELQERIEADKRTPKPSASRDSAASSKRER